jgi:hypothetical protein
MRSCVCEISPIITALIYNLSKSVEKNKTKLRQVNKAIILLRCQSAVTSHKPQFVNQETLRVK